MDWMKNDRVRKKSEREWEYRSMLVAETVTIEEMVGIRCTRGQIKALVKVIKI
jgi:hypothetical protein